MRKKTLLATLVALNLGGLLSAPTPAQAAGFGDIMNPSKWFGGNRDRDYYYDRGRYGYGGYGPGYGGWGGPYGYGPGYGGWGGPYGGYGPGYGWGGGPGYGYGQPAQQQQAPEKPR